MPSSERDLFYFHHINLDFLNNCCIADNILHNRQHCNGQGLFSYSIINLYRDKAFEKIKFYLFFQQIALPYIMRDNFVILSKC